MSEPWYADPDLFWLGYLVGTPIGCAIALGLIKVLERFGW